MRKSLTPKKFIIGFLETVAVVVVAMILVVYFMDPWLYYRIPKHNKWFLDGLYTSAGVIKNAEYDTAVIGSSYFQDFRMDWFREKKGYEPINLTAPGLSPYETVLFSNSVTETKKAKNVIICLTYYTFEKGMVSYNRIPAYLYDNNKWNDYQYFFSYEAWLKFIPMDLGGLVLKKIKPDFMNRYQSMMNRDELGNTSKNYNYSKEEVMKNYNKSRVRTESERLQLLEQLKKQFDEYLSELEISSDIQYVFVLPAHSALYWYDLEQSNQFFSYMEFEKYVVDHLSQYANVRIVNAQTFDEILDLDNYRDFTHFNLNIQEKIVDVIDKEEYFLTSDKVEEKQQKLQKLLYDFKQQNKELIDAIQSNNRKY